MNNNLNNSGGNNPFSSATRNRSNLEAQGQNLRRASSLSRGQSAPSSSLTSGKNASATQPSTVDNRVAGESQSSITEESPSLAPIESQEIPTSTSGVQSGAYESESVGKSAPSSGAGKSHGSNKGQELQKKVASTALTAIGVPKIASDLIVNAKLGKKKSLGLGMGPMSGQAQTNQKDESDKTMQEKEEDEQQKDLTTGGFIARIPLNIKLALFLGVIPSFCFILLFIVVVVSYIADEKAMTIAFAKFTGNEEYQGIVEIYEGVHSGTGTGAETDDNLTITGLDLAGKGSSGGVVYDEFKSRYENMGNIFETFKCGTQEECLKRDEVRFYLKMNDIMLRYKNKYGGVRLDWELIMSTVLSLNMSATEVFASFVDNYELNAVENYDALLTLDWDIDYKNLPGYTYLSSEDNRYDLQILAKNMVTKTSTQTCSVTVEEEDGTTSTEVTNSRTDTDIEDMYLEEGAYHLECEEGEEYNLESTYRLDTAKYNEFLLEYLEHKLFLDAGAGSFLGNNGNLQIGFLEGNNIAEALVNTAIAKQGIGEENVDGNRNEFTRWMYGNNTSAPWCATFVSWVVANAEFEGTPLKTILNYKDDSVRGWANYFYNHPNYEFVGRRSNPGYVPKAGDIIFYNWDCDWNETFPADSRLDHIGFVVESDGQTVTTIEGNTRNKVGSNKYPLNACYVAGYGVWYKGDE